MPEPRLTSNAAWLGEVFAEVGEARRAGPQQLERVLARVQAQHPGWRARIEHALGLVERVESGEGGRFNLGFGEPGGHICDWCMADEVTCYYPFTPFELVTDVSFQSGDRFYTCATCREFIEADDWKGLTDWVGSTARFPETRVLWWGFRSNRAGPPVAIEGDQP